MQNSPIWMSQLCWSTPQNVSSLTNSSIPALPGCYVFTRDINPLEKGKVLYIGKADNLRQRLSTYLVDYMQTKATLHKGKAFFVRVPPKIWRSVTFCSLGSVWRSIDY